MPKSQLLPTAGRGMTRRGMLAGAALTTGIAAAGLRPPRARAQGLPTLAVSTIKSTGAGPVFIAVDKGYFKDEGLDVELKYVNSGGDVTLAVASQSVDLGLGAINAAFFNIAAKGALIMFAGGPAERPHFHNTGFIASNDAWNRGMRSLKDIKGARVAVTGAGGGPHLYLLAALDKYGIDPKDVTPVFLQNASNQAAALRGGSVDIAIIPSPAPLQLESDHAGHIIAWAGDEIPQQIGICIAPPSVVAAKRPLFEKFMRGFVKGSTDYNKAFDQLDANGNVIKGPGYDDLLAMLAHDFGLATNVLLVNSYIDPLARFSEKDIKSQVDFLNRHSFLSAPIDLSKVIDRSFGTVTA